MAAGCLFLLLVLYTENAASAVTRKPSDPVRLCAFLVCVLCVGMFISSLCTLRENAHFFHMYSAWECSFLPDVLCCVGMFISSLCTLRGNDHFFPMFSAWECSFLPYVLRVGMFISSQCTLRGNVHIFPMYSAWKNVFLSILGLDVLFTTLLFIDLFDFAFWAVFRIRKYSLWIRISESVVLIYGSGSGR
jgi:hypothetical protein